MGELILWWLSEEDSRLHKSYFVPGATEDDGDYVYPGEVPEYIKVEMSSRMGRNARGRLWCPVHLNDVCPKVVWDDVKARAIPGYDLGKCGGVVMWRHDMPTVKGLGGVFTDRNLDQITQP